MGRIVVTGMGAVTPLGTGVGEFWDQLVQGRCGIGEITRFDAAELPVRIAGEVQGFDAAEMVPSEIAKKYDPFMQYAYYAADEALRDSGLAVDPERTGIVCGTAMAGVATIADEQERLDNAERKRVGPRFVPKILGNVAAAHIAKGFEIHGPSLTVSTACSSGGDAIKTACMYLHAGEADAMVAVGADSILSPIVIYSLDSAKALSRTNDDPAHACRPFDVGRDGFVIGEGGGALVLETEEHALARGADIYGEVLACANTNDAYHVTAPHPEGRGAIACMQRALDAAGLAPADVDYINAHGTATGKGDAVEAAAVREVFGTQTPPVSSTKGATAHMMGAGGITEVIACIQAIRTGIVPPTINLDEVDPDCAGIDFIANTAGQATVEVAMSNAFGFGGQNSSVVVGGYDPARKRRENTNG
ncbi:MAG: beta-ketoacyl-[acyl-carrier-protein] synthase family protein [Coriobacteriaceae bacterium]|nr:beta-ketoacyl-[acyl-carrier-protein] synthase family protein [Coriobacteriaceae bacterium]